RMAVRMAFDFFLKKVFCMLFALLFKIIGPLFLQRSGFTAACSYYTFSEHKKKAPAVQIGIPRMLSIIGL
ncbi:hypothetical protein, partial [Eubacterium sp.]|uniref:hypothetical protein n=1 Tax=Eubacterium sp. TaxID=142586 RepID=UPI0026DF3248